MFLVDLWITDKNELNFYLKLDKNEIKVINSFDCLWKELQALKKKQHFFFCRDLTFFFFKLTEFLKSNNDFLIANNLLIKNECYFLKISNRKIPSQIFIFKNLDLFLPLNHEKTLKKLEPEFNLSFSQEKQVDGQILIKNLSLLYNLLIQLNSFLLKFEKSWQWRFVSLPGAAFWIMVKFAENPKYFKQDRGEYDKFKPSMFGQRIEVFGNPLPNEYIVKMDFKNMFATVMEEDFLYGNFKEIENNNISIEELKYPKKECFYEVEVFQKMTNLPYLPTYRGREESLFDKDFIEGKGLFFCNGYFSGMYSGEDLIDFIENQGEILKINKKYIFEQKGPILKEFSRSFQLMREFNNFNKIICKQILVSLFGRLAMGPFEIETRFFTWEDYIAFEKKEKIVKEKWFHGGCIVDVLIDENVKNLHKKWNSKLLIASQIAAKSRKKLFKALKTVEKYQGRLLYCNTDEIIASFKYKANGVTHDMITWEDREIEDAVFVNSNFYTLKYKDGLEEVKLSGLKLNNFSFSTIKEKFYQGNSIEFNNEKKIKNNMYATNFTLYNIETKNYQKREFDLIKKSTTPYFILILNEKNQTSQLVSSKTIKKDESDIETILKFETKWKNK